MSTPEIFQTLARYNQWMNNKIYDACEQLSDEERKADRGAFFKSLHGTLNHILWADYAWLNRLADGGFDVPPIGQFIHEDFEELRAAREDTDRFIIGWTDGITEDWLQEEFVWKAAIDGKERRQSHWLVVSHLFNHQTHHRGQATTLISQAGLDVGITDLPRMD